MAEKVRYNLTAEEMSALIKKAGEAGADTYKKEREREEKRSSKVEITKERLKSYRRVKLALVEDVPTPEEIEDLYFKALEDLMGQDAGVEGRTERLLKSNAWKRQKDLYGCLMLEKAVDMYKRECEISKTDEAKRRYQALFLMHLDKEEHSVEEISEALGVGEKSVYNDLRIAYRAVSDYYLGM